ncbi:MAG: LLM class flavin-dependent oxidoreductase [Planctomycetes bacterium]|nr:LLM class flavin-dependent oxidoreductase [Planctomycetota bacterium]
MTGSSHPQVGVIFKSYEPLDEIAVYARATEEAGLEGGFWIAEAYHWFRNYGHESRGAITTLAMAIRATERIPVGLGIISPYVRHPTVQAAEAAALDELSGGRFIMGMGTGKVGVNYIEVDLKKATPVKVHREAIEIFRGIIRGERFSYKGEIFQVSVPPVDPSRMRHRSDIPIYIGATGPSMQRLAGEIADGLILPGLTSPGFVRYSYGNLRKGFERVGRLPKQFPVGGVILASVSRSGAKARDAARGYAATYVVNKIRNIQNDVILSSSGITEEELAPMRKALEAGKEDLTEFVSDRILRRFTVVAGTPEECVPVLQELVDAGLDLSLMEVVGADADACLETIRLLGMEVVPRLVGRAAA